MERSNKTKNFYNFPELDAVKDDNEYLCLERVLKYRLNGLTVTAIYEALETAVPIKDIREIVRIVDTWLADATAKTREHTSEVEFNKLMTLRRLDILLEERIILLRKVTDDNLKQRILTSLRDDINSRADLLGIRPQKGASVEINVGANPSIVSEDSITDEELIKILQGK